MYRCEGNNWCGGKMHICIISPISTTDKEKCVNRLCFSFASGKRETFNELINNEYFFYISKEDSALD